MNWQVTENNHVIPIEDTYPHTELLSCWCHPTADTEDDSVIIHHSFDERELWENKP